MNMPFVGKRIKERRLELGLTQKDINYKTGISTGNLSDIENGKKLPASSTLCMLSDALNCSIDWILKGVTLKCENCHYDEHLEIEGEEYFFEPNTPETMDEQIVIHCFRQLDELGRHELQEMLMAKVTESFKRRNDRKADNHDTSC